MKPTKKHTPERSPDQDRITFSLPKRLKDRIDLECAKDRRTRSQWLNIQLEKIVGLSIMDDPKTVGKKLDKAN